MAGLAKELDKKIAENKRLAAVINFSGKRTDAYLEKIEDFAKKNNIKNIALTTSAQGSRFKVSDEADVTVMNYKGKRVKYNFAKKGKLSEEDVKAILKGVDTITK